MDERIDALLADLEADQRAQDRHSRRGELADEIASQAAEKTLVDRLRGALGQTVRVRVGEFEISGVARFLGADIFIVGGHDTVIVARDAISSLRLERRHHHHEADVLERLGMASILRRLAAVHAEVALTCKGAPLAVRGQCDFVAADYLEVADRIIPLAAIAYVSTRVDPLSME